MNDLINAVIDVMKEQVCSSSCGADWSNIEKILSFVPQSELIKFLPEDQQAQYKVEVEKKPLLNRKPVKIGRN